MSNCPLQSHRLAFALSGGLISGIMLVPAASGGVLNIITKKDLEGSVASGPASPVLPSARNILESSIPASSFFRASLKPMFSVNTENLPGVS